MCVKNVFCILGLTADEIVEIVHLPQPLAEHKYLQEFYGSVPWAVRSVYQGYLGWFDGSPENIYPMTRTKKMSRWQKILGENGFEIMLNDAEKSLEKSKYHYEFEGVHLTEEIQWCIELTTGVLKAPNLVDYVIERSSLLAAECMRAMASTTINAQARNYFLTSAKELDSGLVIQSTPEHKTNLIMQVSIEQLMNFFPSRFAAERCDVNSPFSVAIEFTDLNEIYTMTIRNCVLDLVKHSTEDYAGPVNCKLTLRSNLWRKLVAKQTGFLLAHAFGRISVQGDLIIFKRFMDLIDTGI